MERKAVYFLQNTNECNGHSVFYKGLSLEDILELKIKNYSFSKQMNKKTSLVINKKNNSTLLSKTQKEFNRLIKKTEKLRDGIVVKQQSLDELLSYYSTNIRPEEKQVAEEQIKFVKQVYQLGKAGKLNKKQQKGWKYALENLLDDILQNDEMPGDELVNKAFEEVHGKSFEELQAEEYDALRDELSTLAKEQDVDMDFDWLNADTSEDEMIRRLMEEAQKIQSKLEQEETEKAAKKKSKPKTAAQITKEERLKEAEKLRNKSLSEIYKSLAKVLHPDLESDAVLKKEKEALMKKLTVAHKQKDLHTLLSLELEWIHKEEDKLTELAEDKLKSYNEVLKIQVKELETELYQIQTHPRYEPLSNYTGSVGYFRSSMPQMRDLTKETKILTKRKLYLQKLSADLSSINKQLSFKAFLQDAYNQYMEEERELRESEKMLAQFVDFMR